LELQLLAAKGIGGGFFVLRKEEKEKYKLGCSQRVCCLSSYLFCSYCRLDRTFRQ
jgi:hypothetical protein